LAPNLVGNASGWGSFFLFKSRLEHAMLVRKTTSAGMRPHLSPGEFFVASALAGAGTTLLTNPVWVLKTRLLSTDRASVGAYPGFVSGVARLWREEGLRGFYRGLGASLLGVSHGAVQFAVYEPAKRFYLSHRPQQASTKLDNDATVAISTAAKLVAGAVTYPYQVVRSRLQNHEAETRYGRGIVGVASRVWVEEGPRGLYRGVVLGMVRVMPATWVTFLVYENMRFYLPEWVESI
jgi:solute carrier family 25 folate transporter 32